VSWHLGGALKVIERADDIIIRQTIRAKRFLVAAIFEFSKFSLQIKNTRKNPKTEKIAKTKSTRGFDKEKHNKSSFQSKIKNAVN